MEIQKVLILSTGHLPLDEFENLIKDADMPFRCVQHEYGKLLIFAPMVEAIEWLNFNKEFPKLSQIVGYMLDNDILRVDFDQDGELVDEFEQFDW